MKVVLIALGFLALANGGFSAGIPLNRDHEFNFEFKDVLSNENNMEAIGIDTRTLHPSIEEDARLLVPELIRKYGYGVEVHHVLTSDGYTLEMHRITSSPRCHNTSLAEKQPCFLMHGLSDASSGYVIMGPYHGLAYLLADQCYDVWLGNSRGNRYSRQHTHYNPDGDRNNRRNFFDFSWHEIGAIDLRFMIDYVLDLTNFKRLQYIGHSQGTTSFFVLMSELPEYNDKIISMQALAPVVFMSNLYSPLVQTAAANIDLLVPIFRLLGIYEFMLPPNIDIDNDSDVDFFELIAGSNPPQTNETMLPVIAGHNPAGASTNNFIHYGQLVNNGLFRQFDHGIIENRRRYGSIHPPNYNLNNVKAPIALHYSLNDWLASEKDVYQLHEALPNSIGLFQVPDPKFTHIDFIWAIDVVELLYKRMFEIMRSFESTQ